MKHQKRQLLFIAGYLAAPVLLIWIGYCVYSYTLPGAHHVLANAHNTAFYDLPRLSIGNIPGMGHDHVMKISLSLEVPAKEYERVEDFEPRIVEKVLLFMHGKTPEELQKPDGQARLRESLQQAIGNGAYPIHIVSVAIREMVVE